MAAGAGGGGANALHATAWIANPATPGAAPRPYLSADWGEYDPAISPDGRWAAFTSLEDGSSEVYVRAFPQADSRGVVKISSGGGQRARWSGDGRTIYYQALDGSSIRAVPVTVGATVEAGIGRTVMTVPGLGNGWDVDWRSGKIYVSQAVTLDQARIVVIPHWLDEFKRQIEAKR